MQLKVSSRTKRWGPLREAATLQGSPRDYGVSRKEFPKRERWIVRSARDSGGGVASKISSLRSMCLRKSPAERPIHPQRHLGIRKFFPRNALWARRDAWKIRARRGATGLPRRTSSNEEPRYSFVFFILGSFASRNGMVIGSACLPSNCLWIC